MKRTIVILALVILASAVFTSCTATRGGGCRASHGYVGYGR